MNIYQFYVFADKLVSPVTGYTCRRITKQNIKQFGFESVDALRKQYPEFPLLCQNTEKKRESIHHTGGQAYKAKCELLKQENINSYLKNQNFCKNCNHPLKFESRNNIFCSRSCSALFHMELSGAKNPATKKKISTSQAGRTYPERKKYSLVSFCIVCNTCIPNKHKKTCSEKCKGEHLSNLILDRIKKNKRSNYRRDKKSYLEDSFEKWLNQVLPHINYEPEYTIRNHLTKKWYFVDFYFPDLNLVVELDGKQHDRPKHKERDMIRDSYIVDHLNIQVFRISHTEYQSRSKLEEVKQLLSK